jgi:hypothetical protein
MALTFKGTQKGVHHDVVASVRNFAATLLGIEDVRLTRLDPAEQHELVELVKLGETRPESGVGFDWDRLGNRRGRFEELLAAAAGLERDWFARQREEADLLGQFRELAAEARRIIRPRYDEPGSLRLPRVAFEHMALPQPALTIEQLGLLALIGLSLENMTCICPMGRIEDKGDDAALVLNTTYGVGMTLSVAPDGYIEWRRDLDHLEKNRWVVIERRGQELHVRRGKRLIDATRRRTN